jgi:hypothetical protein
MQSEYADWRERDSATHEILAARRTWTRFFADRMAIKEMSNSRQSFGILLANRLIFGDFDGVCWN